VCCMHDCLGL